MSEFDNKNEFNNGNAENAAPKNENDKIEEASYSCSGNDNGTASDNETFYHRAPGMKDNGQYNGYNGNPNMNYNNGQQYGNQGHNNNSNGQPNYGANPNMNYNNGQQYQGYGSNPNMNYNNGNYNNGQQYGNPNYNNGQYSGADPFVSGNMAPHANVQPQKSQGGKGMGIASMVCGILSLTSSFSFIVGIILSIVGLILGIVAHKRRPSAFSRVGIITSSIGVGLTVLLGIFIFLVGSSWLDELIKSIISGSSGSGDPFDPNNGACVEIVRSVLFRLGL